MIVSLHTKGYSGSEICHKLNINVSLVDQWLQLYESQRKRSSSTINNGDDLSTEKNDFLIESPDEEIETHTENDAVTTNVIEIVEYVSKTK